MGPKYNHMYPSKRKTKEVLRMIHRECHVKMEVRIRMTWLSHGTPRAASVASRSWKRGVNPLQEPMERVQPSCLLDIRLLSFKTMRIKFVVIYYTSNMSLTHHWLQLTYLQGKGLLDKWMSCFPLICSGINRSLGN